MKIGKRIPWDSTGYCEGCATELHRTAFRTVDGGTYCTRNCAVDEFEREMQELDDVFNSLEPLELPESPGR